MKKSLPLIVLLLLFSVGITEAHPGRTDANGGHYCRTNCDKWGYGYGEYHSHDGGGGSTGGSYIAPVQETVQEAVVLPTNTPLPLRIPTKAPTRTPTAKPAPYIETALDKQKLFKVVSVIDGDTFDINLRGKIERVRLLAIDTPETKDPRKPVQCFGMEATKKLKSLIGNKFVKLVDDRSQGNRDKYKRLLRYAYDGKVFVNAEMVKQGFAFSYKEYPTKFLAAFNKYEQQARDKELGLWGSCNGVSPTKVPTKVVQPTQKAQLAPKQPVKQQVVNTSGGDKDCGDFSTHAQAQVFFEAAGAGDPHRLDRDGDGSACEDLP
jgi:micrococcal nuclease